MSATATQVSRSAAQCGMARCRNGVRPINPIRIAFQTQNQNAFKRQYRFKYNLGSMVSCSYGVQWITPDDAYVTLGLAHCFERSEDGKLIDRFVIEPITANSLECMSNGARTCFKAVWSTTLGDVISKKQDVLPSDFQGVPFCENFEARVDACARTWMRPHAIQNLLSLVPLGQVKSGFNFDTTDRRVLNFEYSVTDDDNIKQDISIDVYGRKEVEQLHESNTNSKSQNNTPADEGDEDDDALDSLLSA